LIVLLRIKKLKLITEARNSLKYTLETIFCNTEGISDFSKMLKVKIKYEDENEIKKSNIFLKFLNFI
tara:strand:- start:865 stop:1065 length:201 start_codon:yes stop_codon:yes gene_type:complete